MNRAAKAVGNAAAYLTVCKDGLGSANVNAKAAAAVFSRRLLAVGDFAIVQRCLAAGNFKAVYFVKDYVGARKVSACRD